MVDLIIEIVRFIGFLEFIELGVSFVQKLLEFYGVQGVGFGVDVDEDGDGADLGYGLGGGDESVRGRDHGVPRADAGRHEGETQGVGAGTDADAVSAVAKGGEFVFEAGHLGTADEHTGGHGLGDGGYDFSLDLFVLGFKV